MKDFMMTGLFVLVLTAALTIGFALIGGIGAVVVVFACEKLSIAVSTTVMMYVLLVLGFIAALVVERKYLWAKF